jgi:hypothetical protein
VCNLKIIFSNRSLKPHVSASKRCINNLFIFIQQSFDKTIHQTNHTTPTNNPTMEKGHAIRALCPKYTQKNTPPARY